MNLDTVIGMSFEEFMLSACTFIDSYGFVRGRVYGSARGRSKNESFHGRLF